MYKLFGSSSCILQPYKHKIKHNPKLRSNGPFRYRNIPHTSYCPTFVISEILQCLQPTIARKTSDNRVGNFSELFVPSSKKCSGHQYTTCFALFLLLLLLLLLLLYFLLFLLSHKKLAPIKAALSFQYKQDSSIGKFPRQCRF